MQGYNYRNKSSYKKGNPRPWPWAVAPTLGRVHTQYFIVLWHFHGITWFRTEQYPVPAPSPQYGLGPPKGYTILLLIR